MAFNIIDFANISLVIAFLTGLSYCLYSLINIRSTIASMLFCDQETNSRINFIKIKTDEKIEELDKEILSQKSKLDEIENEVKQKKK